MEREYPPWRWPAAVECRRQREGGLLGQTGTLANHRKLWDCKAMGTKASNSWSGAMLARLLDTSKPFEKTGHKATGPTAVFFAKNRYGSPAAGYFASEKLQRKEDIYMTKRNWNNLSRRGLAMFLALIMCMGMLPVSVFAEEGTAGHWHNEDGWNCVSSQTLVCECEEHTHDEMCYNTELTLICENEDEDHEHSDICYETSEELTCEAEEHQHGDSCYAVDWQCEEPEAEPETEAEVEETTEPEEITESEPAEEAGDQAEDETPDSSVEDDVQNADSVNLGEISSAVVEEIVLETSKDLFEAVAEATEDEELSQAAGEIAAVLNPAQPVEPAEPTVAEQFINAVAALPDSVETAEDFDAVEAAMQDILPLYQAFEVEDYDYPGVDSALMKLESLQSQLGMGRPEPLAETEHEAYFYVWNPAHGEIPDHSTGNKAKWWYIGRGSVNLGAPGWESYPVKSGLLIDIPMMPDRCKTLHLGGVDYKYNEKGGPDTFKIVWNDVVGASGATTADDGNQEITQEKTWHVNGSVVLESKTYCTVDFKVRQPNSTSFSAAADNATSFVKKDGYVTSVPGEDKVPGTKVVDGETFIFNGWYDNEECSGEQVDFKTYAVTENTTFYGKYDPSCEHGNTEIRGAVDATCANKGYTGDTYCQDCGIKLDGGVETPVNSSNHEGPFTTGLSTVATCTEPGRVGDVTCNACGEVSTQGHEVSALGHQPTKHDAVSATCVATGNEEYWSCNRCNGNFLDQEATAKAEDVEIAIDPDAHSYPVTWSEIEGNDEQHERVCTLSGEHVETADHRYGAWQVDETDSAKEVRTCTDCGHKQYRTIPTVTYPTESGSEKTDPVDVGVKIIVNPNGGSWEHGKSDIWAAENDGTFTHTAAAGDTIKLEPDPTKESHLFLGWKKTEGTDTVTFTAQWKQTYTLTYDANGGTFAEGAEKTETGLVGAHSLKSGKEMVSREGYAFIGWSDSQLGVVGKDDSMPMIVNAVNMSENKTVYAVWGEDSNDNGTADVLETKYTVVYKNGDDVIEKVTNLLGTDKLGENKPNDPTEDDSEFVGWNFGKDSLMSLHFQMTVEAFYQMVKGNDNTIVLTASWKESQLSYTVVQHFVNVDGSESTVTTGPYTATASAAVGSLDQVASRQQDTTWNDVEYIFDRTENADANLTDNMVIDIYYNVDSWNNSGSETGGDGNPDNQQALVKFVSESLAQGRVSGDTVQVFTVEGETVALSNEVEAKGVNGYAFDYWTLSDGEQKYTTIPETLKVDGGKTYTFTAHFAADSNGDNTPDKYQVEVTLNIAGGTWDEIPDGWTVTNGTLTRLFTVKQLVNGVEEMVSPSAIIGTLPTGTASDGYTAGSGVWSDELTAETTVTEAASYTLTFAQKATVTYPEAKEEDGKPVPPVSGTDAVDQDVIIIVDPNGGKWEHGKVGTYWTYVDGVFKHIVRAGEAVALTPDPTKESFAFVGWTKTVSDDGMTITYTAKWAADEVDEKNPNEEGPDGIPDDWQAKVTLTVQGGTWNAIEGWTNENGTLTQVYNLYEKNADGKWEKQNVTVGTLPTAAANAGFTGNGTWNVELTADTAVTGDAAYTLTFAPAGSRAIAVNYVDANGNRIGGTTVYGTNGLPYTLTSAPEALDANGNHYVINDTLPKTVGAAVSSVDVRYAVDNNGGGTDGSQPDGTPDERQAIIYYSSSNTAYGTVSVPVQVVTLSAESARSTVTLSSTASTTTLSRTYFSSWTQGANTLSTNAVLDVEFEVAGGQTYSVIANFGRTGTGGGGGTGGTGGTGGGGGTGGTGGGTTTIEDNEVPLAGDTQLNKDDHFAYVSGYADGTVRPGNNITREEVAAIFYRLLTEESRAIYDTDVNDFSDVASERWSNRAISTLANAGVISGYPDGTFRPGQTITRAEFAAIAAQFDVVTENVENPFSDTTGHWAENLISFAASKGWVGGYTDGTFLPQKAITRAEAMTLINNVLDREVDEEGLLAEAKQWPDNQEGSWYYYEVLEATNSHDYTRRSEGNLVENWTAITNE